MQTGPSYQQRLNIQASISSSFRFFDLPQELQDCIYRAYCKPYAITAAFPSRSISRSPSRNLRPHTKLLVRGPPSRSFDMTCSKAQDDLSQIRQDAFDGEVHIPYDEERGLAALHDLCVEERYAWIRERAVKINIDSVRIPQPKPLEDLISYWNDVSQTGRFPQLKEISVFFDTLRYRYKHKEGNFEIPTEEWFTVNSKGYTESFNKGDEDLEYEYPAALMRLRDLKKLLSDNGYSQCEVFMTNRVSWADTRASTVQAPENGSASMQSIKFRVADDDLVGVERSIL